MNTITDISKKGPTPTGTKLNTKGWVQEAALRMLYNNLDPDVAERPEDLVVYGGTGKAARNWEAFDLIVKALKDRNLEQAEKVMKLHFARGASMIDADFDQQLQ